MISSYRDIRKRKLQKIARDLLLAQKGIFYTIPIGKLDKDAVF